MARGIPLHFYTLDFLDGTADMTLETIGAYIRLLAYSWDHGPLPREPALLARLMGAADGRQARRVWKGLQGKFIAADDGWRNPRLEDSRRAQRRTPAGGNTHNALSAAAAAETTPHLDFDLRSYVRTGSESTPSDKQYVPAEDFRTAPSLSTPAERRFENGNGAVVSREIGNAAEVMAFPTIGMQGPSWVLRAEYLAELQVAFPALDVLDQCRRARAWVYANPVHRKTVRGMPNFLVRWLNRAVDRRPIDAPGRAIAMGKGEHTADAVQRGVQRFLASRKGGQE